MSALKIPIPIEDVYARARRLIGKHPRKSYTRKSYNRGEPSLTVLAVRTAKPNLGYVSIGTTPEYCRHSIGYYTLERMLKYDSVHPGNACLITKLDLDCVATFREMVDTFSAITLMEDIERAGKTWRKVAKINRRTAYSQLSSGRQRVMQGMARIIYERAAKPPSGHVAYRGKPGEEECPYNPKDLYPLFWRGHIDKVEYNRLRKVVKHR